MVPAFAQDEMRLAPMRRRRRAQSPSWLRECGREQAGEGGSGTPPWGSPPVAPAQPPKTRFRWSTRNPHARNRVTQPRDAYPLVLHTYVRYRGPLAHPAQGPDVAKPQHRGPGNARVGRLSSLRGNDLRRCCSMAAPCCRPAACGERCGRRSRPVPAGAAAWMLIRGAGCCQTAMFAKRSQCAGKTGVAPVGSAWSRTTLPIVNISSPQGAEAWARRRLAPLGLSCCLAGAYEGQQTGSGTARCPAWILRPYYRVAERAGTGGDRGPGRRVAQGPPGGTRVCDGRPIPRGSKCLHTTEACW